MEENLYHKPQKNLPISSARSRSHGLLSAKVLTKRANIVDAFMYLSVWVLSILAAKVKRAGYISYLTFIVRKARSRVVLLGDREFPGNQQEKKFLTWAPVERVLSNQFGSQEQK